MKYKSIILDVDSTLVKTSKKADALPTQAVISAIKKAHNYVHVGVATSRPISQLESIFSLLDLSGPSIISGGR